MLSFVMRSVVVLNVVAPIEAMEIKLRMLVLAFPYLFRF
jgi:hypothetical protein